MTNREVLDTPITEIPLSVRAASCLTNAHISNVRELIRKTPDDLRRLPNFSRRCVLEIEAFLSNKGLQLGMTEEAILKLDAKQESLQSLLEKISSIVGPGWTVSLTITPKL